MKKTKLVTSMVAASVLLSVTGCQVGYVPEHAFEMEFEDFIDQMKPVVEIAVVDYAGLDVKAPKASKFKETKQGYLYEKDGLSMQVYLMDDEVSRVEITVKNNKKMDEDDAQKIAEEMASLWMSSAFVLQPILVFDAESNEEFMEFLLEAQEESEDSNKKFTDSFEFYDALHEVTYLPNRSLTVSITALDEDPYITDEYEMILELMDLYGAEGLGDLLEMGDGLTGLMGLADDYYSDYSDEIEDLFEIPSDSISTQSPVVKPSTQGSLADYEVKVEPGIPLIAETTEYSSPQKPAKLGEEVYLSLRNLNNKENSTTGTIVLNKIIRGDEVLKRIDEYNAKSKYSTIDYSDLNTDVSEVMLFEYTVTAPLTDSKDDYYGSISSEIVANDGESSVKYGGYSYAFSMTNSLNLDYVDLRVGEPATFVEIVEVPKGYDDFLIKFSVYEGETDAYYSVKR